MPGANFSDIDAFISTFDLTPWQTPYDLAFPFVGGQVVRGKENHGFCGIERMYVICRDTRDGVDFMGACPGRKDFFPMRYNPWEFEITGGVTETPVLLAVKEIERVSEFYRGVVRSEWKNLPPFDLYHVPLLLRCFYLDVERMRLEHIASSRKP